MADRSVAEEDSGSAGLVELQTFTFGSAEEPFVLDNGQTLRSVTTAYEVYGALNAARDNVILVEHGLTGSSHAAGRYSWENRRAGYWDGLIGPGRVLDTTQYCVVAPNALGGCRGSTGPASLDPASDPAAASLPGHAQACLSRPLPGGKSRRSYDRLSPLRYNP